MIEELSTVVLTADLPQHGLRAGDQGMVLMAHGGGKGYTVEFTSQSGETLDILTLHANQVRPIRPNDNANREHAQR